MKYFYALLIACLLFSCSMKLDDEDYRKEFVSSCADEFTMLSDESVADSLVLSYCNCAAEKILTHFDVIDLIRLNDTTSQVYKESQELIIPCLALLDHKVQRDLLD